VTSAPGPAHQRAPLDPETSVELMPAIGPRRAAALKARGIATVLDCLFHLPIRYEDWRCLFSPRELQPGMIVTIAGTLRWSGERPMVRAGPGRRMVTGALVTAGERVRVVWFNLPPYLARLLPFDREVLMHGKVSTAPDETLQIVNPAFHLADLSPAPALRPVYSLPTAVSQRLFSELVREVLRNIDGSLIGAIPQALRRERKVPEVLEALRYLHCPPASADVSELEEGRSVAHRALALDELFTFELAMQLERRRASARPGFAFASSRPLSSALLAGLPFKLTEAQQRVIAEIDADLALGRPMNRLLVGDVGSGKTVIALWAAVRAVESGKQAAIMAPTGLLAEQHYRSFQRYAGELGITNALLTARASSVERAACLRGLARGQISLAFGTHALIQRSVAIPNLGLAVIDEQHHFGVFDRARLKALGPNAHMLLMTATPIPRSLALVLFANLDVSFLDNMPPGRAPVTTHLVSETRFDTVEALVRDKVKEGGRAYFVLPAIGDEGEAATASESQATVTAMARRLAKGVLGEFKIGTLHGRMTHARREQVMRSFRDGAFDVLVATSMVEVGIDVPEATAMAIVDAHRWGLAQLHQLRGRVGRGASNAECILVVPQDIDSRSRARLAVLLGNSDGAQIARADLELRGPGDLLGSRQSGALPLRFVRFVRDVELITQARALAEQLLADSAALSGPEASGTRQELKRMLRYGFGLADVG
jgi:ATP-dependent DNA helicase RecG